MKLTSRLGPVILQKRDTTAGVKTAICFLSCSQLSHLFGSVTPDSPKIREQLIREAWIGDAVLSLFARSKVLRQTGKVDGELFTRLTSNQFLGCFGEPTKVEAAIGREYEEGGLQQAFLWIEQKLMPLFHRQEENRLRKNLSR